MTTTVLNDLRNKPNNYIRLDDILVWCLSNYGTMDLPNRSWVWYGNDDHQTFVFNNESDATLFILRWK